MAKVRLEAMMWGAGTALGELPPYFMARAARMSTLGNKGKRGRRRSSLDLSDDIEKLVEFETLQLKQQHPEQMVSIFFRVFSNQLTSYFGRLYSIALNLA